MKDPMIKIVEDGWTLLSVSLWFLVYLRIYEGEFVPKGDIRIYLNDEGVEKPVDTEDAEEDGE